MARCSSGWRCSPVRRTPSRGVGFFLGGLLLGTLGFVAALWAMAAVLGLALASTAGMLPGTLGQAKEKEKFSRIFSKTPEINLLSGARFFLFGARDVWFVVGGPDLSLRNAELDLHAGGDVPRRVGHRLRRGSGGCAGVRAPIGGRGGQPRPGPHVCGRSCWRWSQSRWCWSCPWKAGSEPPGRRRGGRSSSASEFSGSSSPSIPRCTPYLILAYTESDKVALNVGFYYMANAGRAAGRGRCCRGLTYQFAGLTGCLLTASAMVALSWLIVLALPAASADVDAAVPAD